MDHRDHVGLLAPALIDAPRGAGVRWADVGAGSGAFTLALADLLGPGATIVAVDRDAAALGENARAMARGFPRVRLEPLVADFAAPLDLEPLDGIVAANSLHFVPRETQPAVVAELASLLRPGGRFVVVEYEAEHGNRWVPYPFTFDGWAELARGAGLVEPRAIGRVPNSWLDAIWSGVGRRPIEQ